MACAKKSTKKVLKKVVCNKDGKLVFAPVTAKKKK